MLENIDVPVHVSHIYKHTHAREKCRAPHRCHPSAAGPYQIDQGEPIDGERTTTSTSGDPFAVLIRIYWRVFEYS